MEPERPVWPDESLFPFQNHFVELDGCRVHYVDEGEGPPLLLLHGNPTWSFLYRNIIKGLRDRYRCVALDYPGFGLSTAPEDYRFTPAEHARTVEQFLLDLDLSEVTMMVQDWGGPIGLGVAGRHPERFHGLVVSNTWGWPVNGDPHFERFSKLMGGSLGRFFIRNFNAFVNLLVPARDEPQATERSDGSLPGSVSRRLVQGTHPRISARDSGQSRLPYRSRK